MIEISPSTTVRDLLHAHPEVFEVLLRHGMCEDCKANPPPVPLGHFAMKHCHGDFQKLARELTGAITRAR